MSIVKHEIPKEFEIPGATAFYTKAKDLGYIQEHMLKELNSTARNVSREVMQWVILTMLDF